MNRILVAICVALWWGVAAWAGTIFYFSTLSGKELQATVPFEFWDKAAHCAAFAAGGVLLTAALRATTRWSWARVLLTAMLGLAVFGGSDELHQLYTPGRSGGDLYDWLADMLGLVGGALLTRLIWRWLPAAWTPAPAPARVSPAATP